jgi:DNA-binding MarR family transcriptional regulator
MNMDIFLKSKTTSDLLFHELIKCSHLIRNAIHSDRGFGFHHGHGRHGGMEMGLGHYGHEFGGNHHHNEEESDFSPHHRGCGGRKKDMARIGQGRLLSFLLIQDGINQKELSELLRISAASVSELLNKLEADGYIKRKQNEEDKRVTNIFLTEGGKFFAQKMEEARGEVSKELFAALDENEQKQLLALISKITNSLSAKTEANDN